MVRGVSSDSLTSSAAGAMPPVSDPSRTKDYAKEVFQKLETSLEKDLWNYLKRKNHL